MTPGPAVVIRPARFRDVPAICELVNRLAATDLMLARTPESVYACLDDFLVAEVGEHFAGCGALKVWSRDLGEVRSLAVDPEQRRHGLGRRLVDELAQIAVGRGLKLLFAFTLVPGFFDKLGFTVVGHESLPQKVFTDCLACPKFEKCDEIAMVRVLQEGHVMPDLELAEHIRAMLPRRRPVAEVPEGSLTAPLRPDGGGGGN